MFKKISLFLLSAISFSACQIDKASVTQDRLKPAMFFVGTYTEGKSESEGIYAFELDGNGKLINHGLAANSENPSYITKSANGKTLLAVNELEKGTVEAYQIDGDTLTFINRSSSGGMHPCYVFTDENGYVFTANYSSGTVGVLKQNSIGLLSDLLSSQRHEGKGIHKRQDAPHAHMVRSFEPTKELISVDLGTNQLWFSSLNTEKNELIYSETPTLDMTPGAGPRHFSAHPNGKWLYVINELDNTVSMVEFNKRGDFKKRNSVSTLPAHYEEASFCADIHLSADGKFLYASNRGHNSIAIFSIDASNGSLHLIGHESVRGNWPRNFALSPDERFLIVANQRSNNLVVFKRNTATGLLTFVDEQATPTPVCIAF
ncbi:lactonase family protein [bacterium]|nr:MAG: lactonase family protein [bacterium]